MGMGPEFSFQDDSGSIGDNGPEVPIQNLRFNKSEGSDSRAMTEAAKKVVDGNQDGIKDMQFVITDGDDAAPRPEKESIGNVLDGAEVRDLESK